MAMARDWTAYRFAKGTDGEMDREFSAAPVFEKVRPGQTTLFWKSGLRWYQVPFHRVRRVYRQVEAVYGKLCAGGRSYLIQRLVVILTDGTMLTIHIGDDVQKDAEALYAHLQQTQPQLEFGKEAAQ